MPNPQPHPKRPLLPTFPTWRHKHKPSSPTQLEQKETYKNPVEEKSISGQHHETDCTEKTSQKQAHVLQAQEEQIDREEGGETTTKEEKESKEREMLMLRDLTAQEARKLSVRSVRARWDRDKALPSAPWDEGLREKYGIFYE